MQYTMDGKYMAYLSELSHSFLGMLSERREAARKQREERLKNYPIQLTHVEFTEGMKKSFNIDRNRENSYFHITDKETGKKLCTEMIYVGGAFRSRESLLEELNDQDKPRYIKVRYAKEAKFTKADRKKYTYLTGNYRYDDCYAVLDRETMSLVWKSEERFGTFPTIYNNVMSVDSKYIYIPTMETISEKSYGTTITTKTKIIIQDKYNESAKVIDTVEGTMSTIE